MQFDLKRKFFSTLNSSPRKMFNYFNILPCFNSILYKFLFIRFVMQLSKIEQLCPSTWTHRFLYRLIKRGWFDLKRKFFWTLNSSPRKMFNYFNIFSCFNSILYKFLFIRFVIQLLKIGLCPSTWTHRFFYRSIKRGWFESNGIDRCVKTRDSYDAIFEE